MRTVIIIQARLGSTRLPAKVMLPLPNGRLVVEEVYERCSDVRGADEVLVACPEHDLPILSTLPIDVIGPAGVDENNVLHRYVVAAKAARADRVVRITADCPLLDAAVVDRTIDALDSNGGDYCSNAWPTRTWPLGYDCEVFDAKLLVKALEDQYNTPYDLEHVTPSVRRMARALVTLEAPQDMSGMRGVLDTLEDYRVVWEVIKKCQ